MVFKENNQDRLMPICVQDYESHLDLTPDSGSLLQKAVQTKEIFVTGDLSLATGPEASLAKLWPEPAQSIVCAPIAMSAGKIYGVLVLGNRSDKLNWDEALDLERRNLAVFTRMAAIMLRNSERYEKKEKECAKFRGMVEMISAVNSSDIGVSRLLYTISKGLPLICDAAKCTCFIVNEDKDILEAVQGEVNIQMPRNKGIAGAVATTGETINLADCYADERFNSAVDRETGFKSKSMLAMPVLNQNKSKVLAVVQLVNKFMGDEGVEYFTKQDEEVLQSFLTTFGCILESSELYKKKFKHGLTEEETGFGEIAETSNAHRNVSTCNLNTILDSEEDAEGEGEEE
ncbi:unnamed protein product [Chrysoparadoxa australica]